LPWKKGKIMNMRKLLAAFFFCGIAFTLSAQQLLRPRPSHPDGPSLAATMQFIQTKVQERGRLNFAVYTHDNADGKDYVDQYSSEASNIVADPAACRISYHGNVKKNGAVLTDTDVAFSLHDVQDLVVMPAEQDMKRSLMPLPDTRPGSRDSIRPCFWSWSEELEIKRMDSILPMKRDGQPRRQSLGPCGRAMRRRQQGSVLAGNGAGISQVSNRDLGHPR